MTRATRDKSTGSDDEEKTAPENRRSSRQAALHSGTRAGVELEAEKTRKTLDCPSTRRTRSKTTNSRDGPKTRRDAVPENRD